MVIDLPEILELDINPLLADSDGVIALDARVRVGQPVLGAGGIERLAIRPYPEALEQTIAWQDEHLLVRPIRPEDGQAHIAFFNALTPEDIRFRMFIGMRELQLSQLARFTQIDYDREMAFIATRRNGAGQSETLAVARVIADPDNIEAEFAVIVRSDLKGCGLGKIMMTILIDYCRSRGTRTIVGEAMTQNKPLLGLIARMGFTITPEPGEGIMRLRLDLHPTDGEL